MQVRILQASALATICSVHAPLAGAHGGEHAGSTPLGYLAHLLGSPDHWPLAVLSLAAGIALYRLLKVRSRS